MPSQPPYNGSRGFEAAVHRNYMFTIQNQVGYDLYPAVDGSHLDALLIHELQLHEGWLASTEAAAPAFTNVPKAVLYSFAADPGCAADQPMPGAEPVPPRRWNDAALAVFANQSPTIACECPEHVAEMLMQLSHFEAALKHVAPHEGLLLPPSATACDTVVAPNAQRAKAATAAGPGRPT